MTFPVNEKSFRNEMSLGEASVLLSVLCTNCDKMFRQENGRACCDVCVLSHCPGFFFYLIFFILKVFPDVPHQQG